MSAQYDPPLFEACVGGHESAARLLLDMGANPDARNREDAVPLHAAACSVRRA